MRRSDLYFVGALVAGSNIGGATALISELVLIVFYWVAIRRGE